MISAFVKTFWLSRDELNEKLSFLERQEKEPNNNKNPLKLKEWGFMLMAFCYLGLIIFILFNGKKSHSTEDTPEKYYKSYVMTGYPCSKDWSIACGYPHAASNGTETVEICTNGTWKTGAYCYVGCNPVDLECRIM